MARHVYQLDLVAHFENEDLSALSEGSRLQNQQNRLRNRHKIASDFRIRHRNRAAPLNLLHEQRHHAAIAAENITETDRGEHRPAVASVFGQGLDVHFAHALGRAHDIRRIHRFVRRDQNESFNASPEGDLHETVGSYDIVEHGLSRVLLHHRYMLVRRRMKDDLRKVVAKYLL